MDVYRQTPVPAIYTRLDFVRASWRSLLGDCPDDLSWLRQLQRVAAGHACLSELDSPHTLIVKAEFPDDILARIGTSGDSIEWRAIQWKLWDAETLVTGARPAEAVYPANVGITNDFLDSIAHPTSCIPFLRTTEEAFGSGKRKGYQLDPQTAAKIEEIEKPLLAQIKLTTMKQLKPTQKSAASRTTCDLPVSPKLRDSILRRDNYHCVFCGQDSSEIPLEVNHIVPRSVIKKLNLDTGLHTSPANLCVTCFNCNRGKSDNLPTEDIDYYRNAFSSSVHPNHSILVYLAKIAELQAL